MADLVSNIANATISSTCSQSSSVVEKNFQDLEKRLETLSKHASFKVKGQELKLYIKAPEVKGNLPIFSVKDIINTTIDLSDTISLSEELPATLQKWACTTILHLLQVSFPELTSSLLFPKEIPKFVFSSAIPLNHESKGNFFPQMVSGGKIAYIAWDSSGSYLTKGFQGKICDILFKNTEAFCGVALSQDNLKGIEEGARVSAHFMTSKLTIIGILITEQPDFSQSFCYSSRTVYDGRIACDGGSDEDKLHYDRLIVRDPSSRNSRTTFGMLGVQGANVSSNSLNLPDRPKKLGETFRLFCVEIVPRFSSEETPIDKEDLEKAIETQLQKKYMCSLALKKK